LVAATSHPPSARGARFWQWIRHHATAVIATTVDYSVMVAAVELGGVGPVLATAIGAFAGAVANFTMNRRFTYHAVDVRVRSQAWRYALVSAASLGLNVAGEYLFHQVLGVQYVAARAVTSVIVSNGWNYPLQRYFVFSNSLPETGLRQRRMKDA
jgi:putative flippase GtrA